MYSGGVVNEWQPAVTGGKILNKMSATIAARAASYRVPNAREITHFVEKLNACAKLGKLRYDRTRRFGFWVGYEIGDASMDVESVELIGEALFIVAHGRDTITTRLELALVAPDSFWVVVGESPVMNSSGFFPTVTVNVVPAWLERGEG
jgi:hypothetical protein